MCLFGRDQVRIAPFPYQLPLAGFSQVEYLTPMVVPIHRKTHTVFRKVQDVSVDLLPLIAGKGF